jgi:YfiH family protein
VVPFLTDPLLASLPGIRHGFFTREGGVSDGIYRSLNCGLGSADDPSHVAENRARVAAAVGARPDQMATPFQVHGTDTIVVDAPWPINARPRADALVTVTPGIVIGVGTADCGPMLLADPEARVVGAAHAGWKGACSGIVESAVAAMVRLGARPDRIVAALGPTISQPNYEVGTDLVDTLVAADAGSADFFRTGLRAGHAEFDLPGYIVARLRRLGVTVVDFAICTYADADRFFSFRRTTHRGEPDYGRQLSVIMLTE